MTGARIFDWVLLAALAGLVAGVAGIWLFVLLHPSAEQGAFQALGLGLTSLFVFAHPLGTAAGGVLWRRDACRGASALFVKAATLYFAAATVFAVLGNLLAATVLDRLIH